MLGASVIECSCRLYTLMNKSYTPISSLICLLLFFLVSCRIGTIQRNKPLWIDKVSISPDPIVGKIVVLNVGIKTAEDVSDAQFMVDTQEENGNKVHVVDGVTSWQGSLAANESRSFQVSICVTGEGFWLIDLIVYSSSLGYNDYESVNLESTLTSGKLILDSTYSQEETAKQPTPRPVTVSPECSGQTD